MTNFLPYSIIESNGKPPCQGQGGTFFTQGLVSIHRWQKGGIKPVLPFLLKMRENGCVLSISSGDGVCRYVETEKSEDAPFYPFLIVAAAPQQDNRNDDDPAAIVLEEIVKATAHCAFPPFCLFALSYEAGQKVVTERKFYGRKNLFN
ncbi:MAG: hypothetical protein IJ294_03200 [Clostridia bacterium]|nr:hypothetical protein [Clostridia bacterium]